MQVDTDVFAALTERAELAGQVAALGRKVSALTGKVTVMGNRVGHLEAHVTDRMTGLTRLISVVMGADRPAPRHAAPRDRHGLRLVRGGDR